MAKNGGPSPLALFLPLVAINALIMWYVSPVPFYPDEVVHYAYAEHVGRTGSLPEPTDPLTKKQKLLYLDIAFGVTHINGDKGLTEAFLDDAGNMEELNGNGYEEGVEKKYVHSAASYPPLYYGAGAFLSRVFGFDGNLFSQFGFMRLFSLSIYLMSLVAAARAAAVVFPGSFVHQAWAVALVGFQVRLAVVGSSVNSDILAILLSSLVVWRGAVLAGEKDWRVPNTALVLLLSLLSVAVKPQLVLLLFFFAAAFAIQQWRHPENRIRARHAGMLASVLIAAVGGLSLWYLLGFRTLEGERFFDLVNFGGGPLALLGYLWFCFSHFFLFPVFMSFDIYMDNIFHSYWMYDLFIGIEKRYFGPDRALLLVFDLFALAGMAGYFYRLARRRLSGEEIFVGVVSVSWWLWIVGVSWLMFDRETHIQGRYFLPAIAASMPMLVAGWMAFGKRVQPWAACGWTLFMIGYFEYEILKVLLYIYG